MNKSAPSPKGPIQKIQPHEMELCFSFKYFDASDTEICPPTFKPKYTQSLMDRLKSLSTWTVSEFINKRNKSVRNHTHDWSRTSRPKGFAHLNSELKDCDGWQFQISQSEHGRVHGIIIQNVFFIIWLDPDHKLNP